MTDDGTTFLYSVVLYKLEMSSQREAVLYTAPVCNCLDQEPIAYRYTCCCCCCCSFWGDLFKKAYEAPSLRIGSGWNLAGMFFN